MHEASLLVTSKIAFCINIATVIMLESYVVYCIEENFGNEKFGKVSE